MHGPGLVQPLFDGPIDIVGDIHGEIDGLRALLAHLGYDSAGRHAQHRRLVFLGDLADRGPDSPATIKLVAQLVAGGRAQCVLGNHDLNILLGQRKPDNLWFFGEPVSLGGSDMVTPQVLADADTREMTTRFFATLPLVLERPDTRVVHACWEPRMVEKARRATSVLELYWYSVQAIRSDLASRQDLDSVDRGLRFQNGNPVKVLTSGLERRTEKASVSNGKLRYEERVPWWLDYHDEPYCIFGHYGLFFGEPHGQGRAMCVDYAVGKRWRERTAPGFSGRFRSRLAAVRFPDAILAFDDGEQLSVAAQSYGTQEAGDTQSPFQGETS
jgi:hypothetical protein